MTPAELRALVEAATKGPWVQPYDDGDIEAYANDGGWSGTVCSIEKPLSSNDAALIVAAVNSLPDLLDRIEELEAGLRVFARCPTRGKHGGPFVIAHAVYEDMAKGRSAPREAYWHAEDFERARALVGEGK
jgi:hypothetical protein